jgi:4'-phosphopantetheinyl transferase
MEFIAGRENMVKLDQLLDSRPGEMRDQSRKSWIHLWIMPLDVPVRMRSALERLVSGDEAEYIKRRLREVDQRRMFAAHGILRLVLGLYTGQDAQALDIKKEEGQKPLLTRYPELNFSLSHANSLGAAAVGDIPVGVDIEQVRPRPLLEQILRRLQKNENQTFPEPAEGGSALESFYEHWTYREAAVKTTGAGLSGIQSVPPMWNDKFCPLMGYMGTVTAIYSPLEYGITRISVS